MANEHLCLTVGALRKQLSGLPDGMFVVVMHPTTAPALGDFEHNVRVAKDEGQTEENVLVLVVKE